MHVRLGIVIIIIICLYIHKFVLVFKTVSVPLASVLLVYVGCTVLSVVCNV